MDFGEFDPAIGVDGYCDAIRRVLYPNSTSESVEAAALKLEYRIYVKGSIFSPGKAYRRARSRSFPQ